MKYLFTTTFLIILHSVLFPDVIMSANDNQLITEIRVFDNDTTFRYVYLYDNLGNKVLETKFYQQDSIWVRKSLNEWIYSGNKCVTQRERNWKNNDWITTYSIDYEYNNDQLNSEIHTVYSSGVATLRKKVDFQYDVATLKSRKEYAWQLNAWLLNLESDFSYFQNGKINLITTTGFQSGDIQSQSFSTFTYNSDGTLQSQLLQEKVDSNRVNAELTNWFYVPNSTLTASVRNKKWMSETSSWENTQNIDYQYNDNSDILSETYQRWEKLFWQNDIRYDYQYDKSNNLLKKTLSKSIYNDWRGLISINYSDFTSNKAHTIESTYDFWGGSIGELTTSYIPFIFNTELSIQKGKSLRINYAPFTDTALPDPLKDATLKFIPVYPNPSDGIFYINTQEYAIKSLTVTNINGQVVKSQMSSFLSGVIDLTDFPKGIYLLRVITADEQLIQKLIKE